MSYVFERTRMLHYNILRPITYSFTVIIRSCSSKPVEKWDLCTAVCLERKPVVVPPIPDLEKKFSKQLYELELERSHKSPHEIRHEQDIKQLELLKKGDVDVDVNIKQTAQDFVDASLDELNKFKLAPLKTKADETNNLKSVNRQLDKYLFLLTQQKLGSKNLYIFPQGTRQDGETLRQTAERVLKSSVGQDVRAEIYGNAPVGFYKYKYPENVRNETNSVGAKVFFYFARYRKGSIPEKQHFKWLTREEMEKELPGKYYNSVQQFLIDE